MTVVIYLCLKILGCNKMKTIRRGNARYAAASSAGNRQERTSMNISIWSRHYVVFDNRHKKN